LHKVCWALTNQSLADPWPHRQPHCNAGVREFLTHKTTCANVMSERITSEIFCQRRPLLSGGTPRQATRGTCRLGQCRQGGAATTIAGMWPGNVAPNGRLAQVGHAASPIAGRVTWPACRHPHCRHPLCTDSPQNPGADSHTALISTLTGVFFRRESGRNWYVTCDMQSVLFLSVYSML
jgi:hypothetical protein